MEKAEEWDDVEARKEALRRKVAEEEVVAPVTCEMEDLDEWDDAKARSEALRRRVVTEEEAVAQSPGMVTDMEMDRQGTTITEGDSDTDEAYVAWKKWKAEEVRRDQEKTGGDYQAWTASRFRDEWIAMYSPRYGSFEDITEISPMRFTYMPAPPRVASLCNTLQIFSVKVAGIRGGLQWPVDVFGMVAIRDNIDNRRNVIFNRERENCQTLTEEDPYLVLTGPKRAVVVTDPVTIEVKLEVKGTTETEDKDFSFLAVSVLPSFMGCSNLDVLAYTSKLSTLEFTIGHIMSSLEATISVQVVKGSWPDGFRCQIAAYSASVCDESTTSTDEKKFVLLDSKQEKVPFDDDGSIKLSRRVACVELLEKKLKVSVKATQVANKEEEKGEIFMPKEVEEVRVFTPKEATESELELDLSFFCKMKVTVAWSLLTADPVYKSVTVA